MKIERKGAAHDGGKSGITVDHPIGITCLNEGRRLEYHNVEDFGKQSHHNYQIFLSFDEIANIVEALAKHTPEQKNLLERHSDQS
jgi:hypothetical protein